MDPRALGDQGETLVAEALARQDWNILAKNYRRTGCEIDLAASKGTTLAVIEVKSRTWTKNDLLWDDLLPERKLQALQRGALRLVQDFNLSPETIRIDLAVVRFEKYSRRALAIDYYVDVACR